MITLLSIGKVKDKHISSLIQNYSKRIYSLTKFHEIVLSQESSLETYFADHFVVLLTEGGKQMNSIQFSEFLKKHVDEHVVFVIGGAFGFSPELKKKAHFLLSLSPMTLQHDLAHLVFVEQLYRGLSILQGLPYHK